MTALDIVEFVARHIDQPSNVTHHGYFGHDHYFFQRAGVDPFDDDLNPGQAQFQNDVNLLFDRNGIAFELGDDLRVRRLGPPEVRTLISDLAPDTGDSTLDSKINDAVARFLSRRAADQRDALEHTHADVRALPTHPCWSWPCADRAGDSRLPAVGS